MKRVLPLVLLLAACAEEPVPVAIPLASEPRAPIAEAPSPEIVSPHVRRVPRDPSRAPDLRPPGLGGGGGGAPSERARHRPTERQIAELREALDREMADRPPEPDDEACDRFYAVQQASLEAARRPGQPALEAPSRAESREVCRGLPAAYRECLSPEYFRDHVDACQREIQEISRRGRQRQEAAQRELDEMRAGRRPWPGREETGGQRRLGPGGSLEETPEEPPEDG